MSDTAKTIVKFAAITAAVYFTGGAAASVLSMSSMGWGTAAMISGLVTSAISGRNLRSQIDKLGDDISTKQPGIQVNSTGTEVSLPIIYGKAKVGMSIVDTRQAADVNTIALVGAFAIAPEAGSGIEAVTDVYFNELQSLEDPVFGTNTSGNNPQPFDNAVVKSPWNGNAHSGTFGTDFFLEYFLHDGDDAQVKDFALNAEVLDEVAGFGGAWGADAKGVGVAYIVLWLYFTEAIYTNGVPNVTLEVKGNKVKDCQNLSAAASYSENPADCIYDYMTSTRYGLGIPTDQIDEASFSAAAAYCDESVTITIDGGDDVTLDDRFTCNGFLMPDDGPLSNLERLLSSCCGRIVTEGGKYKLVLRKAQSAETFELDRTNIVGEWSFVRTGIDETPNTLVCTYVDVDLNYTPQPITIPEAGASNAFLTEDNDYAVEARLELPFTENAYMAQMIASQQFLDRRADMGCTLVAQREALKLAVGDVVNVTHDTPSWSSQTMWVEAVGLRRDGLVGLALKEYDADAYVVPEMTVKGTMVPSVLPARYVDADAPTVQILNFSIEGEAQETENLVYCDMSVTFSGGMGSYNVHHKPDGLTGYDYEVDFTGTSFSAYLFLVNGSTPFDFDSDPIDPTGRSTITLTPYPEASLEGIAGPAITLTFQVGIGE